MQARTERYRRHSETIRSAFEARGLRFLLPAAQRSSSVTNVYVPDGVRYADLHDELKHEGYVIYGVQQELGDVFRVATMGQLSDADIAGFLSAFDRVVDKLDSSAPALRAVSTQGSAR